MVFNHITDSKNYIFRLKYNEASLNVFTFLGTLLTGLFFDVGTISFIVFPSIVYYFLFPNKWIGSWIDKIIVWFFTTLVTFILVFTFFAEITFWDEFKTRFNFIAVDYLIYTHEVVKEHSTILSTAIIDNRSVTNRFFSSIFIS